MQLLSRGRNHLKRRSFLPRLLHFLGWGDPQYTLVQFGLFIKKWDSENFKPKQTAAKFSANIICYCSICLREIRTCGSSRAPTPTGLCENFCLRRYLLKLKVFAVLFRHKHSEAVHQTAGRGVGKDNGFCKHKGRAGEV